MWTFAAINSSPKLAANAVIMSLVGILLRLWMFRMRAFGFLERILWLEEELVNTAFPPLSLVNNSDHCFGLVLLFGIFLLSDSLGSVIGCWLLSFSCSVFSSTIMCSCLFVSN